MTESPKRVVILGATSAIAQAAARIWAGDRARALCLSAETPSGLRRSPPISGLAARLRPKVPGCRLRRSRADR